MKPNIDPKVDCVFKAILGKEEHKGLLIHFLNAVLQTECQARIQDVTLLNPYNDREFESDKLSVVDVKAQDSQGRIYQVEIQLALHPGLPARMLYTWSAMYHGLLGKGKDYTILKPVIAIWLLNESLFPALHAPHLAFEPLNREHGVALSDHFRIHLLQLPDWRLREEEEYEELDRWMYLFTEGDTLDVDDPPVMLQTQEMREAMQVLQHFSENERDYLLYQSRLDAERVENTWKREITRLQRLADEARQREDAERQEKERLLALLKQAGIDPS